MRAPRQIELVVLSAGALSLPACGMSFLELFPDGSGGPNADAAALQDVWLDAADEEDGAGQDARGDRAILADVVGDVDDLDQTSAPDTSGPVHMCPPCDSSTPYCDTTIGLCVECIGTPGDCPSGQKCNQVSNTCELPCTTSSQCMSPDVCDLQQLVCADCTKDSDCQAPEPVCVQDTCVACRDDSTCPGKHCKNYTCVDCLTTSECPSGQTCIANTCT